MNSRLSDCVTSEPHEQSLLDFYLLLPPKQRQERFADTVRAAELTSLSVRTIQFWIECGYVQAVVIGRKYRIDLDSLRRYLRQQMQRHVES